MKSWLTVYGCLKEPTGRVQLLPQGRALPATFIYLFLYILIFNYYLFILERKAKKAKNI
ncbi:hypothetical protein EMIT0194MI4_10644 [Pseudomonas sp. IT-194MI4]